MLKTKQTCVAPNCDTGKESVEKNRVGKQPNLHRFPRDEIRKEAWRRAVPKDVVLTDSTRLCSLHFTEDCYETEKSDKRKARGQEQLLKHILKKTAVPSIWPNCPAYMSKFSSVRRTSLTTSETRDAAVTYQEDN